MFHSIAHILQHLFKVEGVTVSLSDVLAGLALVKGSQLLRRASGEQFLFAHKPKDGSADDVVHSLMRGQQPALSPEDRERFEDAQYFARYAIASYGWLLYAYDQPVSCLTSCVVCGKCDSAGNNGSECCSSGCCHWNINTFLHFSQAHSQDLLIANLTEGVGSSVFYMAIDHVKRCVVIAIRGTMSMADVFTDLNARTASLADDGFPDRYDRSSANQQTS